MFRSAVLVSRSMVVVASKVRASDTLLKSMESSARLDTERSVKPEPLPVTTPSFKSTPSMVTPAAAVFSLMVSEETEVNVPAPALLPPMVAPSMAPPSMSTLSAPWVAMVPKPREVRPVAGVSPVAPPSHLSRSV